jgi:hypothetical protein
MRFVVSSPLGYFINVLKVKTKAIVTRLLTIVFSMVVVCVNHGKIYYFRYLRKYHIVATFVGENIPTF